MRILHYSLGFPPYRTGGLTKFCMDLMTQQLIDGHEVANLWPGKMKLINRKTKVKWHKDIQGIRNFEIINPLPVPYDEGIKDFEEYKNKGDKDIYFTFLERYKPDVIHIHTLMGLHKSMLEAAKQHGIRLVFSTHDFFPICPKVTMFKHGEVCESKENCNKCGICNNTALSINKIRVLQSPLYRFFKDSTIIQGLRKRHRDEYLSDDKSDYKESVGTSEDYLNLRQHYYSMLYLIDSIHYNSTVAKAVYEKECQFQKSTIISISHANISDKRRIKQYSSGIIRIRYLGPQSAAKGYYSLIDVLNEVWKKRKDFRLDVHFNPKEIPPYMNCHERYSYNQLESILSDSDVLICPSLWFETFGYTVLEALSYGVPVIISDHVGAKDIVGEGCGIVYSLKKNELINCFNNLSYLDLANMNKNITSKQHIVTIAEMAEQIMNNCYIEE